MMAKRRRRKPLDHTEEKQPLKIPNLPFPPPPPPIEVLRDESEKLVRRLIDRKGLAQCSICCYWLCDRHDETQGDCRRYPVLHRKEATHWCGEFAALQNILARGTIPITEVEKAG
jgi:hypothetical protein